uniref:Uncharacterized protein n=1 Tax=Muribaculaceae bacterium Z82 TaxID=2304548 RepID=A0A7C9JRF7_9BACT
MDSVIQSVAFCFFALLEALFSTDLPFAPLLDMGTWQWFVEIALRGTFARAIVAAPVAYYARCKGYSWCGFFLIAMLFMPAGVVAVLVALPRIEGDRLVWPKDGGGRPTRDLR